MENDIAYYHDLLKKNIRAVERDENDKAAIAAACDLFLKVFNMIKMIMISQCDRYYGCFLMNFDLKIDCTLYYDASVSIDAYPFCLSVNPLLMGNKPLSEIVYVICHEIEHIVLNHPAELIRYNPQKDPLAALKLNFSMDASINDRLNNDITENGWSLLSQPKEAVTSKYLAEEFMLHLKSLQAFDYYYERIPDTSGSPFGLMRNIPAAGFENEIITEKKRKNMQFAHAWTVSDSAGDVESLIRRFVFDVCAGMPEGMRGRLPEQQKQALALLLSPPAVSWKHILKRFIGTVPEDRRKTRTRLNRRQPERYDLSGKTCNKLIKLVVAVDTSGSMDKETLEKIFVEIFDIIGTRKCEVTVIECDSKIQRIYKARSKKDILPEVNGRGGTSFVPVIEYINSDRRYRSAVLIYFTDGMGDRFIPRPRTQKNLWVLYNDKCSLSVNDPYGKVMTLNI